MVDEFERFAKFAVGLRDQGATQVSANGMSVVFGQRVQAVSIESLMPAVVDIQQDAFTDDDYVP